MLALFSNTASATLASSISTSSTAITVSTGMGTMFPTITAGTFFMATLTDSSNNLEIVKVTGRTSDTLTVVRAQEGTAARAYAAADKIELRIPASVLTGFMQLDGPQTVTGVKTFSTAPTFSTALAVSSGGTGVTTSTGSGSVVLSNSATLVTPALGTPASGVLTNCTGTASGLVAGSTPKLLTTNFTVEESGGNLVFKYGSTLIARMSSAGVFTALGEISSDDTLA